MEEHVEYGHYGNPKRLKNINTYKDAIASYSYLPPETQFLKVLYTSENFYVFIRFFYSLYERIIKMREVTGGKK